MAPCSPLTPPSSPKVGATATSTPVIAKAEDKLAAARTERPVESRSMMIGLISREELVPTVAEEEEVGGCDGGIGDSGSSSAKM